MSQVRPSVYRNALQVSASRVAALTEDDLNVLMEQLLRAQAYKCGSPANEVRVNTEGRAKDDGSDGFSAKPKTPDAWLGLADTCWQFKAGSAGEPARLKGEVTKRIPKDTLTKGGRFVVIASGSTNSTKGETDRLETLTTEAAMNSIPTDQITVIGSEGLTLWCNQHPAVAALWAGRPDGLWSLDDWSTTGEHHVPWQTSAPVQSELEARRADLDFVTGSIHHIHIQGPPGVGKTRFALELCRGAEWRGAVIYIRQAADVRLAELLDSAAADPGVQLTVVADEVPGDQLRPLRDSIARSNGRVRLVTVGHSHTPDPTRIPILSVKPLEPEVMGKVVKGLHPAMPREHVDFVVRFADGYVRLALLAANAVAQTPRMDVRGLLGRDEIRGFLDGMLGSGDRRPLYVVAVMTSVGWADEVQDEGESVARHLGLDWNDVRASVDAFDRRLRIVPRGGRYRYISPTPLGIHLAVEAWTTYGDLLKSLPSALPSERARVAYDERLRSIVSNPQAREYAREELARVVHVDDFVSARAVRRWSALSGANPEMAARNSARALTGVSIENRRRIEGPARRETVSTLVSLAWKPESFHDATLALALLAEAENETWANNATGEFIARFQILLGGTAVPYLDRMSVVDELLSAKSRSLGGLVVKALAQVGNQRSFRLASTPPSDELPEKEWEPSTEREHFDCVIEAITRLTNIAESGLIGMRDDLVAAATSLSMLLLESEVRGRVASFCDAVRKTHPEAREPLRRIIADIMLRERKYWRNLSPEALQEIETLHARFEDSALGARLQQHVGQARWDREEQLDLRALAKELMSAPDVFTQHWPWLTSGDAADAWRLGEALAAEDSGGWLLDTVASLPVGGRDLRLLCGYVSARRQSMGDEWYERWVKTQFERDSNPSALLFEVVWRCGATESVAGLVATTLRSEQLAPQIVGQLEYGRWGEHLSAGVLETVLRAMVDTGHRETALVILTHRIKAKSDDAWRWKTLAIELVTDPEVIRGGLMASGYWKDVANTILENHPREIAAAIFRAHAGRKAGQWSLDHSEVRDVLLACMARDRSKVWEEMQPYLATPAGAYMFSRGFPRGLLEGMPAGAVEAWIAEKPDERAAMVARLASKDFSSDDKLGSRVLGEYGDKERVGSVFLSEYMSGSWSGSSSSAWEERAEALDAVAGKTALPRLRRWASESARSLRRMAEQDREREEEADLRG